MTNYGGVGVDAATDRDAGAANKACASAAATTHTAYRAITQISYDTKANVWFVHPKGDTVWPQRSDTNPIVSVAHVGTGKGVEPLCFAAADPKFSANARSA